jgi:hypothetical protein
MEHLYHGPSRLNRRTLRPVDFDYTLGEAPWYGSLKSAPQICHPERVRKNSETLDPIRLKRLYFGCVGTVQNYFAELLLKRLEEGREKPAGCLPRR